MKLSAGNVLKGKVKAIVAVIKASSVMVGVDEGWIRARTGASL